MDSCIGNGFRGWQIHHLKDYTLAGDFHWIIPTQFAHTTDGIRASVPLLVTSPFVKQIIRKEFLAGVSTERFQIGEVINRLHYAKS